jgi:hypothetical protein
MIRPTSAAVIAALGGVGGGGVVYLINAAGGSVAGYVATYDQMQQQGRKVVVRGDCASSCTMMLGYSNMCLDKNATLRFHPAYNSLGAFWVLNPWSNQQMISHYPADAWKVIEQHGDLANPPSWGWGSYPPLFTIKATEFPQHLCEVPA